MTSTDKRAAFEASYADLNEGPRVSVVRLRQLLKIVHKSRENELWPLALVNVASCMEWFARTIVKHLIDYSADRINPDARILRDLKLNYALVLQAHTQNFSIGDIVATSRNFTSFDDIDGVIEDLTKEGRPALLARIKMTWSKLVEESLSRRFLTKRTIARELNEMFRKRNELIHGSPRHLSYRDQLDAVLSREELIKYIHCSLQYIRHTERALIEFIPQLQARSTLHNNFNQWQRLDNSEKAIKRLEVSIEKRVRSDAKHLSEFKQAQRAWRVWKDRESRFQTAEWGFGSGRAAILMGYETTFNMERLRSLEAYIRQLDDWARARQSA